MVEATLHIFSLQFFVLFFFWTQETRKGACVTQLEVSSNMTGTWAQYTPLWRLYTLLNPLKQHSARHKNTPQRSSCLSSRYDPQSASHSLAPFKLCMETKCNQSGKSCPEQQAGTQRSGGRGCNKVRRISYLSVLHQMVDLTAAPWLQQSGFVQVLEKSLVTQTVRWCALTCLPLLLASPLISGSTKAKHGEWQQIQSYTKYV